MSWLRVCAISAAPAPRPPAAWLEHMEDSLILHLLYNQPNTWQTQSGQTPAVPRRLTLAETYMRDHLSAPLTLTDIARHAGASATGLTRLFQVHRDTTPMNALRALRLVTARQQLKTNATASVTEVALGVGFGHLGRFSEYYRERGSAAPSPKGPTTSRRKTLRTLHEAARAAGMERAPQDIPPTPAAGASPKHAARPGGRQVVNHAARRGGGQGCEGSR
ncbi:hypothetical protein G6F65_017432 [Rhizopus arrhizus]|nr:hypothetical protein G6F65_017432 [Rhizopus arrhizus]